MAEEDTETPTEEEEFTSAFAEFTEGSPEPKADAPDEAVETEAPPEPAPEPSEPEPEDPWADLPQAAREHIQSVEADKVKYEADWKAARNRSQGEVSALAKRAHAAEEQLRALQAKPPAPEADPPSDDESGDSDEFEKEYGDIATHIDKRVDAIVAKAAASIDERVAARVKPMEEEAIKQFYREEYAALDAAHDDWETVTDLDDYKTWLAGKSHLMQQAAVSRLASEVAEAVTLFKAETNYTSGDPDGDEPSEIERLKQEREEKLRASSVRPIKGSKTNVRPAAADDFSSSFAVEAAKVEDAQTKRA